MRLSPKDAPERVRRAIRDLEDTVDKKEINVRLPLVRRTDGFYEIDQEALRDLIVALSIVFEVDEKGQLAFSSTAVEAPLELAPTTGAIRLRIGDALTSNQTGLAVVPAAALADTAAAAPLATLIADHNTLLANLRAAKHMLP